MKRALTLFLFLSFFISANTQNIVSVDLLESRTKEDLVADFGVFIAYGADLYKVTYETPDIHGVMDTASGLFVYPVAPADDKIFPMLIYQHGTVGSKDDVPSELKGGFELALFWAGVGYATTAADFLGLGEARGFHPYVHSRTEASAAIDMHLAVKEYAMGNDIRVNDQLFVTGYSQGGHAGAAAQKMIQEEYQGQLTVTASAPMSGPYSVSGIMTDLMLSENDNYFFLGYAPYTLLSYDLEYDLFDSVDEIFKEPNATWIEQFQNAEIDLWELNENLIQWATDNFGVSSARFMFQDSIVAAVQNDPNHPVNLALLDNDLMNWAPEAPTRLYYCTADDQVPFMNSVVAEDSMLIAGSTTVQALDVDPSADHGGCVTPAVTAAFLFFFQYQSIETYLSAFELDHTLQFQVVPNPATNQVNIQFKNNVESFEQIELINLSGQTMKSTTTQSTLYLNDVPQGAYFIKVTSNAGVWIEKLIKN